MDTVICADTNFCYVKQALIETGLKRVIVTNLTDLLPPWKRYLGVLFDRIPTGKVDFDDKVYRFKALLKHPPLDKNIEIDPWKDLSYILYTGGTTGFPKGVPGTHIGMTSYVNDVTEDVADTHLSEDGDTYIAINPLFHIMALGLFMAVGLNRGNATLVMPNIRALTLLRYPVRGEVSVWITGA